jgi:beta-phosphoglucomutase
MRLRSLDGPSKRARSPVQIIRVALAVGFGCYAVYLFITGGRPVFTAVCLLLAVYNGIVALTAARSPVGTVSSRLEDAASPTGLRIGAVSRPTAVCLDELDGVIFDMDGVLCDSEPFIAEAAIRMFAERYGSTVRPEEFAPFVGTGEDRYLGGVAERHGIALNLPSDKHRTYEIYLEIIRGRLKPLPGAVAFVRDCRASGLKVAVATSADAVKLEGNLREIGLPVSSFDAVVCGDEVAAKKPAPDIFLVAARKMGCAPGRCLVVEDAPNGVRAAKAAGCRCLGIMSSFGEEALENAGADAVAPDLERARAFRDGVELV